MNSSCTVQVWYSIVKIEHIQNEDDHATILAVGSMFPSGLCLDYTARHQKGGELESEPECMMSPPGPSTHPCDPVM